MTTRSLSHSGRKAVRKARRPTTPPAIQPKRSSGAVLAGVGLGLGVLLVIAVAVFHANYTLNFQWPMVVRFQWPAVIAHRDVSDGARNAQVDQHGRALTAYQQYACAKFGSDCRLALAIQRAENPQGKCEIYHHNTDGTLDWGYFQLNTVHLQRPGLNLRDLLDCRANIDFAYQLFKEKHGFTPWSTYKNGSYRRFLNE